MKGIFSQGDIHPCMQILTALRHYSGVRAELHLYIQQHYKGLHDSPLKTKGQWDWVVETARFH